MTGPYPEFWFLLTDLGAGTSIHVLETAQVILIWRQSWEGLSNYFLLYMIKLRQRKLIFSGMKLIIISKRKQENETFTRIGYLLLLMTLPPKHSDLQQQTCITNRILWALYLSDPVPYLLRHCWQAVPWRCSHLKASLGLNKTAEGQVPHWLSGAASVSCPTGLSKALLAMSSWKGSWFTQMNDPREGARRKSWCLQDLLTPLHFCHILLIKS